MASPVHQGGKSNHAWTPYVDEFKYKMMLDPVFVSIMSILKNPVNPVN
jgi:hypothetical protein